MYIVPLAWLHLYCLYTLYCILFYLVKVDLVADEPLGETDCSAKKLKVELL